MSATVLSLLLCVAPMSWIVASQLPWVYPGDFNERLIVSGTIASTARGNTRTVDGVEVTANEAKIKIDRIFKGEAKSATMQFLWFSPASASGFLIYSGPPLADFKPSVRYLVFLRHGQPTTSSQSQSTRWR